MSMNSTILRVVVMAGLAAAMAVLLVACGGPGGGY